MLSLGLISLDKKELSAEGVEIRKLLQSRERDSVQTTGFYDKHTSASSIRNACET